MAVTKKIEIDGKEVTFKASAAVPRLYRRTDYIPCILWGRTALAAAERILNE